jgi:hypothetical protein
MNKIIKMESGLNLVSIFKVYDVALCHFFRVTKELGFSLLDGEEAELTDPESYIDFAVLFKHRQ